MPRKIWRKKGMLKTARQSRPQHVLSSYFFVKSSMFVVPYRGAICRILSFSLPVFYFLIYCCPFSHRNTIGRNFLPQLTVAICSTIIYADFFSHQTCHLLGAIFWNNFTIISPFSSETSHTKRVTSMVAFCRSIIGRMFSPSNFCRIYSTIIDTESFFHSRVPFQVQNTNGKFLS